MAGGDALRGRTYIPFMTIFKNLNFRRCCPECIFCCCKICVGIYHKSIEPILHNIPGIKVDLMLVLLPQNNFLFIVLNVRTKQSAQSCFAKSFC